MGKRLTYNIITGNDPHLRMCFYYSPYFGMNIWRRGSSLTGERTKKDPAFKGFRKSINRMKEASPIAASLYKRVPEQLKQYTLYRTLTGEAIKMLKEGIEAAVIVETLEKKYIDPLLNTPKKNSENKAVEEPVSGGRKKSMPDFISYPQWTSDRKMTRARRSYLLQKITEGQPDGGYFSAADSYSFSQTIRSASESTYSEALPTAEPKRRTKTASDLIYLGRLPECKKLKIWLRPVNPSDLGSII